MNVILKQDLDNLMIQLNAIKEDLKQARIFITGGTGFIGCWFLESIIHLNEQFNLGIEVTLLTRDIQAFKKKMPHLFNYPSFKWVEGDIRTFAFPDQQFTHVIHGATEASSALNIENPQLMYDVIVDGTKRVLELSEKCKARKILFISSGAVYGHMTEGHNCFSEDDACLPEDISAYAKGKYAAEQLCFEYVKTKKMPIKIARCFSLVGPYLPLNIHYAIGNFMLNVLNQQPIHIRGDGSPVRSYMYASDLICWLWHILVKGEPARPYNVGSNKPITVLELAQLISKVFNSSLPMEVAGQPKKGEGVDYYVPCIDRAKKELGLSMTVDLKEALQKTKEFLNYGH